MSQPPGPLERILGHPLLIALLGAGFAGYSGYVTGSSDAAARLKNLEQRMIEVEQHLIEAQQASDCRTRILDRLEDKAHIVPPCQVGDR